jgi:malonyl-CoA O-methyltransferase
MIKAGARDVVLDPTAAYRLWAPTYPPVAHTPLMRLEERAVRALLPDLHGATVVDVGCGTGRYLELARAGGAAWLAGIDPSAAMLDRVRVPAARLVRGGVEALPLRSAIADVTICALTLGHVPSLGRAFAELARITRPGGVLLCSELHPIGATLGWRRTFTAQGQRFAVRDAGHSLDAWHTASAAAGWALEARAEPVLQPGDLAPAQRVDPVALRAPSALVLRFVRAGAGSGPSLQPSGSDA